MTPAPRISRSTDLTEFKTLIAVFEKVFEMKNFRLPEDQHLQKLLQKEDFFVIIAQLENSVVAGLTGYVLEQYYATRPLAYIYDLAVLQEYQRMGIGKKLIDFTNAYCRQQGYEEVFVQADKADDYAIDFYRATKPTAEEPVVHFYYTL